MSEQLCWLSRERILLLLSTDQEISGQRQCLVLNVTTMASKQYSGPCRERSEYCLWRIQFHEQIESGPSAAEYCLAQYKGFPRKPRQQLINTSSSSNCVLVGWGDLGVVTFDPSLLYCPLKQRYQATGGSNEWQVLVCWDSSKFPYHPSIHDIGYPSFQP